MLKAAEEALHQAETEATAEDDLTGFRAQSTDVQSWIKEQRQKLLSSSGQMFEQRLQVTQVRGAALTR